MKLMNIHLPAQWFPENFIANNIIGKKTKTWWVTANMSQPMFYAHIILLWHTFMNRLVNNHWFWRSSRHMVVCSAAQENRVHANYVSIWIGTTKLQFSRILNSMIFYLKNTKVAVDVPAYQGRLPTKFEENHVKCFWDMSKQTFGFISFFFKLGAHLVYWNYFWKSVCLYLSTYLPIFVRTHWPT